MEPAAETLYAEAMTLAAQARQYFDPGGEGDAARARLRPESRLAVATESLRVTSRLLEVVSALIVREAGGTPLVRPRDFAPVPERMGGPGRAIVAGVRDLYMRTFAE
ncbi:MULTISPECIES: DUF1465 family protein [Sphingosinicellaceae]|uniref:DUF1465 family protein n=1 Tax=Sphingosinicellaceae TaxID=2820280 RepID=UPI001C1E8444|nr:MULTISPECIES: DUF1465 family protein [Polymorphobacter]QYE34785.1 DUF1465 family protein [Polymorphobacter sp. PAMC 29334]UAJ08640.1 DUF1465 family protein [Polymorphobacter megasporae]